MTKRKGGEVTGDKKYLVLTESTKTDSGWTHSCGAEILAAEVTHPIWNQSFDCAGSGQVRSVTVPFCPKCEEVPNPNGTPIEE